jgi:hypothetical protein
MNVITDTNSLRGAGLDSPAMKALAEYLRRTRSALVVSVVVREELLSQRLRQLQRAVRAVDSAVKDLKMLVPGLTLEVPVVDEAAVVEALRKKLTILADVVEFVENIPDDLPEMVRRLAGRIPPASSEGEEARDVLLWLTTKRLCKTQKVALLTGDKTFYQGDVLHPELAAEVTGAEGSLEVFHKVDDFLRVHHIRTSFVTEKWIEGQIDGGEFVTALDSFLDKRPDILVGEVEEVDEPTGYSSVIQVVQHKIEDFFVSDLDRDVLYVSATVWAELELEVEYYRRHKDRYYENLGEDDSSPVFEYIYPCVTMQTQFEVSGEAVKRVLVSSLEQA